IEIVEPHAVRFDVVTRSGCGLQIGHGVCGGLECVGNVEVYEIRRVPPTRSAPSACGLHGARAEATARIARMLNGWAMPVAADERAPRGARDRPARAAAAGTR